jgi:hypothetical protein
MNHTRRMLLLQQSRQSAGINGPEKPVALQLIAAILRQLVALLSGFDSLGNDLQIKLVGHRDDGLDNDVAP